MARFVTLPAVYGSHAGNYWDRMVRDFSTALTECGLPCQPIDLSEADRASAFLSLPAADRPSVLLSYNLNGGLEVERQGRTVPITAAAACPTVNLLMDHPVHCFDAIWATEREAAIRGAEAPARLYVPMDPLHVRSVALGGRPATALCQGGPEPISGLQRAIGERPIPVMTFGTLKVPNAAPILPESLQLGAGAEEEGAAMVAEVIAGEDDVEAVVRAHMARLQPRLDVVPFVHAIRAVDVHARAMRRWRLALSLASVPIVHFGEASPEARARLPNWDFRGPVSFETLCARMTDARIVLADTINLRNAALMRTFYAMAHGCVVATDMNAFLNAEFEDGESIVALALDAGGEGNVAKLRRLLDDPHRLRSVATAGIEIHRVRHTWRARAQALIPNIQNLLQ